MKRFIFLIFMLPLMLKGMEQEITILDMIAQELSDKNIKISKVRKKLENLLYDELSELENPNETLSSQAIDNAIKIVSRLVFSLYKVRDNSYKMLSIEYGIILERYKQLSEPWLSPSSSSFLSKIFSSAHQQHIKWFFSVVFSIIRDFGMRSIVIGGDSTDYLDLMKCEIKRLCNYEYYNSKLYDVFTRTYIATCGAINEPYSCNEIIKLKGPGCHEACMINAFDRLYAKSEWEKK